MKNIVTIGGGSGQYELLSALKQYDVSISAIVSMMDDGGSTGVLREQLDVLPPGDIRRCLMALAQDQTDLAAVLDYRFLKGDLAGHTIGNIVLSGFELQTGNFQTGVDVLSAILKIRGKVLPVTFDQTQLCAKLENGTIIEGETNIDIPKQSSRAKIASMYLSNTPKVNAHAVDAISEADIIILTIGDLYTSVIPNLLLPEVVQAIQNSKAKVIYTCNQSNKIGETENFTALDYITALENYLGTSVIDTIVVNVFNKDVQNSTIVSYNLSALESHGLTVIEGDVMSDADTIDGIKLAKVLSACLQLS